MPSKASLRRRRGGKALRRVVYGAAVAGTLAAGHLLDAQLSKNLPNYFLVRAPASSVAVMHHSEAASAKKGIFVNGPYYTVRGTPIGLTIRGGQKTGFVESSRIRQVFGILRGKDGPQAFTASREGGTLVNNASGMRIPLSSVVHAVSGMPLLVNKGRVVFDPDKNNGLRISFRKGRDPRTILGVDAARNPLVLVIPHPVTLSEAAGIAARNGFHAALNADGGSSTHLEINGRQLVRGEPQVGLALSNGSVEVTKGRRSRVVELVLLASKAVRKLTNE